MDKEIEKELKKLYKKWPEMKRFLATIGCFTLDAEDIFQEALVVFARKQEDPSFVLTVEPFYYVKSTCKLLWYNEARKQSKFPTVELSNEEIAMDDAWFQKEMKLRTIESALKNLGKQCQEILELFYGLGWNMVDIAKKIGLRNDKVVKTQKYRCLQKAKELTEAQENRSEEINYSL
jgi:RNA polymerase sigma factor (sigma-70 family)